MNGSMKLIEGRRNSALLGWRSRWQLEASIWAGVLVIAWEMTPLRFYILGEIKPFAEWIALGLAGIAMVTAMRVKRRYNRRLEAQKQAARMIKAPNSLSLVELLREHGVREFGSMYLYMPTPKQATHDAAWNWIDTLRDEGLVIGDPWHIKADHVKETVRQSHAHLFADDTTDFDVFRLDLETLNEIMGNEIMSAALA